MLLSLLSISYSTSLFFPFVVGYCFCFTIKIELLFLHLSFSFLLSLHIKYPNIFSLLICCCCLVDFFLSWQKNFNLYTISFVNVKSSRLSLVVRAATIRKHNTFRMMRTTTIAKPFHRIYHHFGDVCRVLFLYTNTYFILYHTENCIFFTNREKNGDKKKLMQSTDIYL